MTRAERGLAVNNFTFLVLTKVAIYALAGLPCVGVLMVGSNLSATALMFTVVAAVVACPVLVVVEAAMLYRLLAKPGQGKHDFLSAGYYRALRLQEIHEIITMSSFLNNLVNRTEPLRALVHKLTGVKKSGYIIVAPDVLLLDPYTIRLGRGVFIGMRALVSGHLVVGDAMWILPIEIGDRVMIGANVAVSCDVRIGSEAKLDYGVTVSEGCRIGESVVLFRGVMLERSVTLGAKVVVGACSFIGRGSRIGEGVKIGRGCFVGANIVIPGGLQIPDGSSVTDGRLVAAMECSDMTDAESERSEMGGDERVGTGAPRDPRG